MEKISLFAVHMPHAIDKPLLETLHSGYIGQGPKVEEFESELAKWIGFKNLLATNSGTSALQLALRIDGIGSVNGGRVVDEVITTPMTCTASNMPILAAGAVPVFADISPVSGMIDPLDVERKITRNTKAILHVHWGGVVNPGLGKLRDLSREYGLSLIEDAAHAFGAVADTGKIGNCTADYTAFSFQAIKHITTGDGGLLSVSDSIDYKRGKLLRWYGIDRETDKKDFRCEEDIEEWGLKWHMNDICAAIGLEQLKYANGIIQKHRDNASIIWESIDRERFQPAFSETDLSSGAFWLFTVLLKSSVDRLWFMEHLRKQGIQTSQVHARNDKHTVFAPYVQGKLPGVDHFTERMVCIPCHWNLDALGLDRIISACRSYKVLDSVGI